jgi:arylsulfatase A-like enzyme
MKHSPQRRQVLKGALALSATGLLGGKQPALAGQFKHPNILFLLTDNQRFDAVGYINRIVRTPNLDRLAQEGVRFLNTFVTTSVCCTSRASILTGTYARHHNAWSFDDSLPPSLLKQTYPALLRHAGYRTGFFGKYGVGRVSNVKSDAKPFRVDELPPEDKAGFDVIEDTGFAYYEPGDIERKRHQNETLVEKAKQFIDSTPKSQPFCLSISFHAPHVDHVDGDVLRPEPDLLPLYAKDIFKQGPTLNEEAFETLPEFLQKSEGRRRWQKRGFGSRETWLDWIRRYYALATGIDRAIGRIVAALEAQGIEQDTIIIFTSDNGLFLGDHGLDGCWFGYEASIRIPLVIRPLGRPKVQDIHAPVLNIDLAPTMLALAGVPIPETMQGRDVSPLLTGAPVVPSWRTDFLYEHYLAGLNPSREEQKKMEKFIPSSEGVRNERYTYLRYPWQTENNEQLFDRIADSNQLNNIVRTAPQDLVDKLRKRTDELIAQNA